MLLKWLGVMILVVQIQGQEIPSWNMPVLRPIEDFPMGGATPIESANYTQLFQASKDVGTYNMSPMISHYQGVFLASWKNSPKDEDEPGQRVLYSQSIDGVTWLDSNNGDRILFPNISTNSNPTALFAEPTLLLNDNVYAAASPIQFCLYPDQYQSVLLLRQVFDGFDSFGPVFWASYEIPEGYEENTNIHNILTLDDMSQQVQYDISLLNQTNPTYRPCDTSPLSTGHTTKCEYCTNGCQDWNDVTVSTIENERTHYLLPNQTGDVILYRNKGKVPNHLYASVRSSYDAPWSMVQETNITDDVSNINAGNLPDGRAYLVSNALVNYIRDPLYLSTTDETNLHFVQTHVLVSCHMEVFQPGGCIRRFTGGGSQPGCQYPQSLPITGDSSNFYTIFSLNKEDIWIVSIPLSEI